MKSRLFLFFLVSNSAMSMPPFPTQQDIALPVTEANLTSRESTHLRQIMKVLSPFKCSGMCRFTETVLIRRQVKEAPVEFLSTCKKDCTQESLLARCLEEYPQWRPVSEQSDVKNLDHKIVGKLHVERLAIDGLETRRSELGKLFVLYPTTISLREGPSRIAEPASASVEPMPPAADKLRKEPAWISIEVESGLTYYSLRGPEGKASTPYKLFDQFEFEE